jgi:cytochrome P450 family 135
MTAPSTSPEPPPGPRLPAALQTLALLLARRRFVDACRRRYGDLVSFSTLFGPPFVMVADPELAREVFRAPPDRLCAGTANRGVEPLHGPSSLMVLGGEAHLRRRRQMLPPFHGERMRAYEAAIVAATDRAIESWPVGRPFALLSSMYGLTLDVAIGAIFGVEPGPHADELRGAMRSVLEPTGLRAWNRARFDRDHGRLDDLIRAEIRRAHADPGLTERPDVLAALLVTADGEGIADDKVLDELVTLLIAGHETTATSLAWAFELLLHTPSALDRLRETLAAGEPEYLEAVVKETLRMRPAASGVGRQVLARPFELGGRAIPAGTEVMASIETIHRRPDLYPQPDAFRPERHLAEGEVDPAAWIPFGGGVRRCLGAAFAAFEMKVAIGRVLVRAELRAAGPPERKRPRAITPPTRLAFARSMRRGRRPLPARGVRVVQVRPPRARSASAQVAPRRAAPAAAAPR